MTQTVKVVGDNLPLDLLLVRKFGLSGQRLVAKTLALNPGLAALGLVLPAGIEVVLPDAADVTDETETVSVVTLFGESES
ncbi:tail protein X [uncultured Cohaesibacter sp.]|uniref:tail protein X n=1 Tax=uncultured Cohaesibacter sp. TaxID=1002546 RepID=UPI0029C8E70B|nr:tail protein X [uncultured Cohaesibacter sp.]